MAECQGSQYESIPIIPKKSRSESLDLVESYGVSNKGQTANGNDAVNKFPNHDGNDNREIEIQNADDETSEGFQFCKMERRKKIVICLCIVATFLAASAYAIISPFYPLEATSKGMSLTMIGFVFGVYQLVIFMASPIVGYFMTRIGVKFMFLAGIFVGGCSAIMFGTLDKGPDGTIFLVMCILVRCVEAMGFAAFMTASMTIVSCELHDYASFILAILKGATGCGHLFGPIVGGFLYEAGGFGLPFYCIGGPILLNGLIIYRFLPVLHAEKENQTRKMKILGLMHSPLAVVSLLIVFLGVFSTTVFLSTFATYMEQSFGLSASFIGILYTVGPLLYVITAPFFGYITDVKNKPEVAIACACLIGFVGWILNGPCPFLPFIPFELWTCCVGFAFIGVNCSGLTVPTLKCIIIGAHELNYEKGPETFAMVSGLYNSVYAFGGFAGPFIGGILVQKYGFPSVFSGLGILNLVMFVLTLWFFLFRYMKKRSLLRLK